MEGAPENGVHLLKGESMFCSNVQGLHGMCLWGRGKVRRGFWETTTYHWPRPQPAEEKLGPWEAYSPAWMARKLYSSCSSSSKAALCLA